jgi:hypothetical protein
VDPDPHHFGRLDPELDPDPHQDDKSNPDPHRSDADPKHGFLGTVSLYYMVAVCRRMVCLLVGEEKVTEAERQLPCDLSKRGGGSSQ